MRSTTNNCQGGASQAKAQSEGSAEKAGSWAVPPKAAGGRKDERQPRSACGGSWSAAPALAEFGQALPACSPRVRLQGSTARPEPQDLPSSSLPSSSPPPLSSPQSPRPGQPSQLPWFAPWGTPFPSSESPLPSSCPLETTFAPGRGPGLCATVGCPQWLLLPAVPGATAWPGLRLRMISGEPSQFLHCLGGALAAGRGTVEGGRCGPGKLGAAS